MNTPETDARVWSDHSEGILHEVVEASFARKLERERDKAQEDATNYYAKIGELEQERDEARAERDIARLEFEEISNERCEEIQKVLKERDEAQNKLRLEKLTTISQKEEIEILRQLLIEARDK